MPQPLRAITTVPSARDLVYFPFSLFGGLLPERRAGRTLERLLGQAATLRNVNTVWRLAAKYPLPSSAASRKRLTQNHIRSSSRPKSRRSLCAPSRRSTLRKTIW
jgi:hypothetical protein